MVAVEIKINRLEIEISGISENMVRETISSFDKEMSSYYLSHYCRAKNPQGILEKWQERENDKIDVLKPIRIPLIQYSHMGELKDIILRKDNWREVFKIIVEDEKLFESQIKLLLRIRNKVMHSNSENLSPLEIKTLDTGYELLMNIIKPERY